MRIDFKSHYNNYYYSVHYTMCCIAATGKFVFGADLDLLVNPKKEDVEFLDKVDEWFVALGRVAYEPPLYKFFKNDLYKSFYRGFLVG